MPLESIIITRWGTWLSTIFLFFDNFEKIRNVVLNLDFDVVIVIPKTIELKENTNLQNNLFPQILDFSLILFQKLEISKCH